jgi:hypothetical protein
VRFWDASAIVLLLVTKPAMRRLQALAARDPDMLVWWGSEVECVSALPASTARRLSSLDAKALALASNRLRQLAIGWHEIEPS